MILLPAVDVWDDRAVKYSRRDGRPERDYGDAVAAVRRWCDEGARWIHIVDLNGALGRADNREVMDRAIDEARARGVHVQIGGGLRDEGRIARYLDPPRAERVIVSTRAVEDPEWLRTVAARFPDRLVLALESYGDKLAIRGWREESPLTVDDMIARVRGLPLAAYMFTNLNVEGRMAGLDWTPIEAFLGKADRPVVISGGVTTVEEVRRLAGLGVHAAILGSTLYSGRLRLSDVLDL